MGLRTARADFGAAARERKAKGNGADAKFPWPDGGRHRAGAGRRPAGEAVGSALAHDFAKGDSMAEAARPRASRSVQPPHHYAAPVAIPSRSPIVA